MLRTLFPGWMRQGSIRTYSRAMINLENTPWLTTRAQLARSGGHKGQARIPPEAVDGYMMALRRANSKLPSEKESKSTIAVTKSDEGARAWNQAGCVAIAD